MVGDLRSPRLERLALRHLAVEQAQRVDLEAALAVGVQLVLERPVVGAQQLEVRGPALVVADGVELECELVEPYLDQPRASELDDLHVHRRAPNADRLDVELEELPVAPFLRPVVAEHRPDQIEARGLRALVQPAFEVGAHDARCGFGPQGKLPASSVLKAIELLGHGVGVLAHALDQLRVLDDRRLDLSIAEPMRDPRRRPLGHAPQRALLGEDVADTADGLDRRGSRHKRGRL